LHDAETVCFSCIKSLLQRQKAENVCFNGTKLKACFNGIMLRKAASLGRKLKKSSSIFNQSSSSAEYLKDPCQWQIIETSR
jgi:hypothetical protein